MEHCAACGHGLREGARFCDACGASVGTAVPPTEARKVVTVLFADLVGSTRLQETLDPESARRVIDRFAAAMAAAVTDHGGTVVKMMGDGLMAAWGVPTVAEDDAVRAVRTGLDMQQRLESLNEQLQQEWGVRLRMRVGVNTGEVVVGADDDVIGDPVNVAARLESSAPPGRVLVGEQTRRLVRDVVGLESVPPLALRGKDLPVAAWLATTAAVGDRSGVETPFVARDAELARLRAAFDGAVAAREARLVTVIGSPGMGKSRLAAEFAAGIAGEARVVEGRCEHSGEGITYLPVAEVLRALADVTEAAEPAVALAALQAQVGEDDADTARIAQRAAGVLGLEEAGPPEETFWAVRRLLEAAARERPLVVVLDDVHWGEPQFLELVEHVATWTRGAPLLLVALARPELRDVRSSLCVRGPLVLDVVELSALDAAASRALVAGVLGGDGELPPALAERVVGATGGNPLFLGETLRMLLGDGVLRREDDGTWIVDADEVDVPPTIHALLAARLERLATGERQVVERASVIGKSFPRGGVEALLPGVQEAPIDDRLDALRRRELVEPEGTFFVDEPVFRFHHVLIRDAAYRALLKEARAELHERFADWLTDKAADRIGEHEEVVGYHLEQAHEYRRQLGPLDARAEGLGARAAACLASSGRRALAREDLAAAANLLERALTRGGEDAELLADLVEVHLSAGDATAAEAALERLDVVAGRDRRLRARVAVAGVELGRLTGEIGLLEAERELSVAAEVLATVGDDAGHAKALELLARSIAPLGRIAEAEAVLDRALAAARRAGDGRRVTAVLSTAPIVALYGPSPVPRASGRCLDVVRILRMGRGNRHVEARALRCQAVLEAMRGRADAARAILVGARSTFEELGLRLDLLELGVFDAMVELLLGEPEAAERVLRVTASGLDGIGAGGALAHALLGMALEDQGRHEEAIAATRVAETLAGDDLQATALWVRVRALALAGRGDLRDAEEHARRAVVLADGTDALADHADCRLALARVLRAGGRDDEAAAEATRAARLYAAKGHEVGVGRAVALGGTAPEAGGPAAPRGDRALLDGAPAAVARADGRERAPARVLRQMLADIAARDWDAHRRLYAAGFRGFDGRTTGQPAAVGPDAAVATVRSIFTHDTRIDVDVLLEDERVQLQHIRLAGSGSGGVGAFEAEYLSLVLVHGERMLRVEMFDVDDEAAARARATELMRTPTAELIYQEFVALFRAREWDALEAMYDDAYAFADRRMLGWEPMGRGTALQVTRSIAELYPDLDTDHEILEADEYAVLVHSHWRGHAADGGGAVEYELFEVGAGRDGLLLLSDWFSPEQEEEARARAAEVRAMVADQAPPGVAELYRRVGRHSNERDWVAYEQLFLDGATTVDHSTDGNPPAYGRAAVVDAVRSVIALAGDAHVGGSLLDADERTGLFRVRLHGHRDETGGAYEVEHLHVVRGDGDRIARIEMFAADDLDGARARYEQMRARTLPSLLMEQWMRLVIERDWDALRAVRHAGFELIDHRPAGWGRIAGTDALAVSRSMTEAFPDIDGYYEEIDGDDVVTLGRFGWHGHAADGGGLVDFEVLQVLEQHEGRMLRNEYFAPDDGASARARLAAARGHTPAVDPVVALARRMANAFNRRDWDALRAVAHGDALVWDHRPLIGGRRTFDALVARQEELAGIAPDVRLEIDEVLETGPDHGVWRWALHGTSDGGDVEAALATAWVLRDGLLWRGGQWDAEQVAEARAWCAIARSPADIDLDSPVVATAVAFTARLNRRDWAAAREWYADEAVAVDHRALGRGTLGADEWIESSRRLADLGDLDFTFRTTWFVDQERALGVVGYAGRSTDGGSVDIEYITLACVAGGRIARNETFDLADAPRAWARLVEFGADPFAVEVARVGIETRTTPGPTPPDAFIRLATEYAAANNVPDLARLRALLHDDFVARDHRSVPAPDLGPDGQVERVRLLHEVMPRARLVAREWLQVGPDHVLVRVAFETTHDDGAHTEWEWLARLAHRDGRFYVFDTFDVDDADAARAWSNAGDMPESLRLNMLQVEAHETRDWAADLEIFDPSFVLHDVRLVGTGRVGRDDFLAQRHGLARMAPDVSLRFVEVWDADDVAMAGRVVVTGTSADGAAFEWELVGAIEVAGGRLVRWMWCDAERVERARAWCQCAQVAPGAPLDDLPSWRALRHWLEEVHTGEAALERPHPGARCALLDVLEGDDQMLLVRAAWRWAASDGSACEQPFLALMVAREDTVEHLVTFAPGAEQVARARFAAFARSRRAVVTALPGAHPGSPAFRATFAYLAGIAVRDWDLVASAYAPGAAFADNRPLGLGMISREEHLGRLRGMIELSSDVRFDVLETLVAVEHGFIVRTRWSGTDAHGGDFEIEFLTVVVAAEDGYERVETFDPDDEAAARARFLELAGP